MGHYDPAASSKMWQWAKDYTLADNFFMGPLGARTTNHRYYLIVPVRAHRFGPAAACATELDSPRQAPLKRRTRPRPTWGRLTGGQRAEAGRAGVRRTVYSDQHRAAGRLAQRRFHPRPA